MLESPASSASIDATRTESLLARCAAFIPQIAHANEKLKTTPAAELASLDPDVESRSATSSESDTSASEDESDTERKKKMKSGKLGNAVEMNVFLMKEGKKESDDDSSDTAEVANNSSKLVEEVVDHESTQ